MTILSEFYIILCKDSLKIEGSLKIEIFLGKSVKSYKLIQIKFIINMHYFLNIL